MKAVAGTPAILHNKIAVALFIVSHTNYRHTMIIGGFKTFKLLLTHFLSNFFFRHFPYSIFCIKPRLTYIAFPANSSSILQPVDDKIHQAINR